jgi:hypothetical protein
VAAHERGNEYLIFGGQLREGREREGAFNDDPGVSQSVWLINDLEINALRGFATGRALQGRGIESLCVAAQTEGEHHMITGRLAAAGLIQPHRRLVRPVGQHPRFATARRARVLERRCQQSPRDAAALVAGCHTNLVDPELRRRLVGMDVDDRRHETNDHAIVGGDRQAMSGIAQEFAGGPCIYGIVKHVVGMVPPGKAALNPAVNAVQSLVVVERGADIRIALLHNTPAAFHGRPELAEQLTRELTDALRSGRTVTA